MSGIRVAFTAELDADNILMRPIDGIDWFTEITYDVHGYQAWRAGVKRETERNTVTWRQLWLLRGLLNKPITLKFVKARHDKLTWWLANIGLITMQQCVVDGHASHEIKLTVDGRKRINELFIKGAKRYERTT